MTLARVGLPGYPPAIDPERSIAARVLKPIGFRLPEKIRTQAYPHQYAADRIPKVLRLSTEVMS